MIDNSTERLVPEFKEKLHLMFNELRAMWLDCYIFESYRTIERQYELYWKWRTKIALRKAWVPEKYAQPWLKIVTWTLQSKHMEGRAVDIVFDANKDPKVRVPTWTWPYTILIQVAKKYWIRSLAPLEVCHFEI